mmetsp:Transcript_36512/g.88494  ORF Transcript_36512/g.88494 Transcript_36512/m.88494 type:complete len:260 (-) Transcript_36512:682-1461(-)
MAGEALNLQKLSYQKLMARMTNSPDRFMDRKFGLMYISRLSGEGIFSSFPVLWGNDRRCIAVYNCAAVSKKSFGEKSRHRQDSIWALNCLAKSSVVYSCPVNIRIRSMDSILLSLGIVRERISAKHRSTAMGPIPPRKNELPFALLSCFSVSCPTSASKGTPAPPLNMASPMNKNSDVPDIFGRKRKTTLPLVCAGTAITSTSTNEFMLLDFDLGSSKISPLATKSVHCGTLSTAPPNTLVISFPMSDLCRINAKVPPV